jgi:hypothetical protein
MRTFLALLAIGLASIISMLFVMANCGLEPDHCESVNVFTHLPIPLLLVSPIFLSAVIPSKYKKLFLAMRILSSLLLLIPLFASINNSISFVLSANSNSSDILFGPVAASSIVFMIVLLLWPEIKHLTNKDRCRTADTLSGC